MADVTRTKCFRFWLWLIRVIGVIVPRRLRADWRQEWEAELRYRETQLAEWDKLDRRNELYCCGTAWARLWTRCGCSHEEWEDEMFQDLRYGMRMLVKSPGFTLVVAVTLGAGHRREHGDLWLRKRRALSTVACGRSARPARHGYARRGRLGDNLLP